MEWKAAAGHGRFSPPVASYGRPQPSGFRLGAATFF
jgi:hypothetical protein